MKITELNLQENGKKYCCKDTNEIFEVKEGNLIPVTRSFSMAELLGMDFEEIKEAKNPYTRVADRADYHYISELMVYSYKDDNDETDNKLFSKVNYFNNKEYAEYIAFKETLMRRMDRFAWEHNEKVINWYDGCSAKYYIQFSNIWNEFIITPCRTYQSNDIYFTSREIAEKALEKFKEDLIKLYKWKFDF